MKSTGRAGRRVITFAFALPGAAVGALPSFDDDFTAVEFPGAPSVAIGCHCLLTTHVHACI